MKISLNWLTDYVDVTMPAVELGKVLTDIGLNCDGIAETGDDVVFDLDVTSNRPDWLGHIGVARELAAATGAAFHPPVLKVLPTSGRAADLAGVQVLAPDLCPRYTARVIRGVKIGPSPDWLVSRLEAVGLRSVNNVVDVTNFILFEYSQPLHSFDYDKLAGHQIIVRRAATGEHMVSIDGTKCELNPSMLVIADASRPVAIAGIMGGLDSEVSGSTTNILLESAQFDQLTTRRTSRSLKLMSESNYRYERGIDPVGLDAASLRACQLIVELAGGTVAEGLVDVWAQPYVAPVVRLRPARTSQVLGYDVQAGEQVGILGRLGLSPRLVAGAIECTIPSFRRDLSREIDLIEEVARLAGYARIPVGRQVTHAVVGEGAPQRLRKQVTSALTSAGFDQAITFSFIDADEAGLFGWPKPVCVDTINRRTNNALRASLLPSLLRACKVNQDAGVPAVDLFELAAVFPPGGPGGPGGLPNEGTQLAMVSGRPLRDLRGAVEMLIERVCGDAKLDVLPTAVDGMTEGTSAQIVLDGEIVGAMGMIGAKPKEHYGLEHEVAAATVSLDALAKRAGKVRTYKPLPRFPAVRRDLSIIVDDPVTWGQLADAIESVPQAMRCGLDYVTTYRGKPIPDGRKSVTVTLTYQSPQATLRSEQVDEQVAQIVQAVGEKLHAALRT